MRIDRRITEFFDKELIQQFRCGCAIIIRTGDQICFCHVCHIQPTQLHLPLQEANEK